MTTNENLTRSTKRWWHSETAKVAARIFVYANIALFVVGFLSVYANRFDDAAVDGRIVDGIALAQFEGEIYLGFVCDGVDAGYRYALSDGTLRVHAAPHAKMILRPENSLSALFPVSREQIAIAISMVGGSVGMASLLDKVRVSAIEAKTHRRPIGFVHQPSAAEERTAARLLMPMVIAGAAAGGIVIGYFAGAATASKLGLDIDCSSKSMHSKLAIPSTWRLAFGTVFSHAYSSLAACIDRRQLRTVAANRVIDYLDAPKSPQVGKILSLQDETIVRALRDDPKRTCGTPKQGMEVVGPDGKSTRIDLTGRMERHRSCWTEADVTLALAARRSKLPEPLGTDRAMLRDLVQREFPQGWKQGSGEEPTEADALRMAFARLSNGHLLNEKGEVTVDVRDMRLLLEARKRCQQR